MSVYCGHLYPQDGHLHAYSSASTPRPWMQTTWKYILPCYFVIEKERWWCCVESEFLKYLCFALFAFFIHLLELYMVYRQPFLHPYP